MQDHIDSTGYTDLHNRLEHLVTYSSQLIFISGEGLNVEQDFVESYLAQKSNIANIAYLGAANKLSAAQYRQRIVEQLLGKLRIDYSRPLTEILPRALGSQEQFILIAVTHADCLPKPVLRELWDLVLQNRFAGQRHHLNILLFAEHQWAEEAKSWLPTNHSDQPVLLSHHSLPASRTEDKLSETELETLIREKRQQFELRIQQRNQVIYQRPILSYWWAKLIIVMVFVGSFGGLMQWQYGEQSKALLTDVYAMFFEPGPQPVNNNPEAVEKLPDPGLADASTDKPDASVDPVEGGAENQQLVTNWSEAVKQLDKKQQQTRQDNLRSATKTAQEVAADSGAMQSEVGAVVANIVSQQPEEPVEQQPVTEQTAKDNSVSDYPVEDIVNLDQLATSEIRAEAVSPEYNFDESVLLSHPSDGFYLQLSGMSSQSVLKEYIEDNQLTDRVWVYQTQRYGGSWYVVLLQQHFPSIVEARQGGAQLPDSLDRSIPFAKLVGQVQEEINNAN